MALVRVLAGYHYGVLNHHCPWCLFLPGHRPVGYPLFAALSLVAFEGPTSHFVVRATRRFPQLTGRSFARSRVAGFRAAAAVFLFVFIACLPAIVWRLRFGVWMN